VCHLVSRPVATFPSMRGRELLRILERGPLGYVVARQRGSHRKMTSPNGYPDIRISFHDGQEIPPGVVRKVLVDDLGLSEEQALALL
jgi:predicted RNA binding protein YcfA (HicA-like mRNA interferase family)